MTFEEFFKKKRIDLDALQKGEPALFSEFKTHYEQMGEKSFDHTKKYWFNKTRRQFPLAVAVKTEKPKIENQLAEQTVTEALIEEGSAPAPKLGFVPKFRAASTPKPATEEKTESTVPPDAAEPIAPAPKLGFVPKFKAGNMPKPATEEKPETIVPPEAAEPTAPVPKLGFVPKFKAANMPKPVIEERPKATVPPETAEPTIPSSKLGFVPKFKSANMPKPGTEEKANTAEPAEDIPRNKSQED